MDQGTERRSTRCQPGRRVLAMAVMKLLLCCTPNAINHGPSPHLTLPPYWIIRVLFACVRWSAGGTEGPGDVAVLELPYRGKLSAGPGCEARFASLTRV